MEIQLRDGGQAIEVSANAFGKEYNETLVHQIVVAYMAAARQGTKAQKTRSEVSGGGIKPWRQKGTGRARAGTSRSPLWRTGGVTFAAKNRSFEQKVNKKMYRGAIRSMLSELLRLERLVVVEDIQLDAPKTKQLVTKLKSLDLSNVLIVTAGLDEKLALASRNLHKVGYVEATRISPVDLMSHENVLVTTGAIRQLEEWLA